MSYLDPVRSVLSTLIEESQTNYTPEGILREFRATAEKLRPNAKLLEVLRSISIKRPNQTEVLQEIAHVLDHKDPYYALLVFIRHFSEDNVATSALSFTNSSKMKRSISQESISSRKSVMLSARSTASTTSASSTTSSKLLSLMEEEDDTLARRKSLEIPTSTPRTARSIESNHGISRSLSAMSLASIGNFRRQHTAGQTCDEDQARGKLSVIKERVLNSVSDTALENQHSESGSKSVRFIKNPMPLQISGMSINNSEWTNTNCDSTFPEEDRTHSLWKFYKVDINPSTAEIGALPVESQQQAVLTEIIYCLSGIRGTIIEPVPNNANVMGLAKYQTEFQTQNSLSKSLAEMVQVIMPLASYFVGIQEIISDTERLGQIANALNAELDVLIQDYYLLLVQLENERKENRLTLQKMVYFLQPTLTVMEHVWMALCEMRAKNLKGAGVLSHLFYRVRCLEGDKETQKIIANLACKAAAPYMRMLQLWIQKGLIVDNDDEFLVMDKENKLSGEKPEHYSGDYWEKRYSVRSECVPSFLEKYKDKILRTGKYLNVIRQCGKRLMATQLMDLHFDAETEQHIPVINDAYYFAARKLLDVLLAENDMMGHLLSVKRYLLLNQGDFIMQFMDACEEELSKNVDEVLPMALENLLGLTLRLSSARNDPYKDDLHCELLPYDLVTQMGKIMNKKTEYWQTQDRLDLSGLECFAFTYEVKWPVSLVLNHIAISKYQMLFRQLFFCKHVERQLCKIWKENSIVKKFSPTTAELYRSAFTLRQRMMNAIQNLEYYMLIEIIEPNWHLFIERMKTVENVDEVLTLHHDFLDICLKNCMLTDSSHLNRAIFKLCNISLKFCNFIQRSQRVFLDAELKSMVCDSNDEDNSDSEQDCSSRQQCESALSQTDTFGERVKVFDLEFTGLLLSFLKQINDLAKDKNADPFVNLVHRINFNSFYTEQIEKLCIKDAMAN